MKAITKIIILILLSAFIYGCGSMNGSEDNPPGTDNDYRAFTNVLWGWSSELIYEHDMVYPATVCIDGNGDLLVADRALKQISKVAQGSYTISTLIDTSSFNGTVQAIAYQPNNNRLLIGTDSAYIYSYNYASTSVTLLVTPVQGTYVNRTSCFTVNPTNDYFYGGSQANSAINSIALYNANGILQNPNIVSNTQGVFQMDFCPTTNTLYFTETYDGELCAVSGNGGAVTVVSSNLGVAGTFEPISVAVVTNNIPYSFDAVNGLSHHLNSGSILRVNADSGAGPISWWASENAIVIGQGAGANIKKFNLTSGQSENLTDYLNSEAVIYDNQDRVLYAMEDKIIFATANSISTHYDFSGPQIQTMTYVPSENCKYTILTNGTVQKIYDDTSIEQFTSGLTGGFVDSTYCPSTNRIYFVRTPSSKTYYIEYFDLNAGATSTNIITVDNTNYTDGNGNPRLTTDDYGNIYTLIREGSAPNIQANIYKYDTGFTRTTMFTDIFGSDSNGAAITVPDIQYSSLQNFLLVSTINDIRYWTVCGTHQNKTFAVNNGSVDNITMIQTPSKEIIGIQSGRLYKFTYN